MTKLTDDDVEDRALRELDAPFLVAALREHYDLTGTLTPLPGEIDQNVLVTNADGARFVLRVHTADVVRAEADLQADVMEHLHRVDAALPVQRLIRSVAGVALPEAAAPDGSVRLLRLTTWLDGETWAGSVPTDREARARAARSLGRLLGRMDAALAAFEHPAARRAHRWDIARAGDQMANAALIDDPSKRAAVEQVLRNFVDDVAPRLDGQPRQIIHNDANDYNVLVGGDGLVSGLIDFGDVVQTWRVNEVAVACAYAMIGTADPVGAILPLVAAYHDDHPLTEIEAETLFDLILTRFAMSISLAARQIADAPDNQYLLISQRDVWERLQRLLAENRTIAIMRLRAACRYEAVATRRHVERWLERRGHEFGPVFDREMSAAKLPVLDLSAGSHGDDLGALHSEQDLDQITPIGRFGEDRALYRTDAFATVDPTERRTIHVGIDLFAAAGVPVIAPLPGVVAEVGCDLVPQGFGGILLLRHETDDGIPFWTLYGHLSSARLRHLTVGQTIAAGETVGLLGRRDENGDWPPHLHFQVMTDLCGWTANEIVGVVARSQWDVWSSVFLNPNLVLGLPVECSVLVARDSEWLRRERRHVLGRSLSLAYDEPLEIVRGEGIHLIDQRGDRYLDMVNNVCHVGHCHPRVVAAGQRQMARLNTNSRYLHDNLVEYSRRLTDTLPDGLDVVFMVNSGSEANDLALRLARTYTGNHDVLTVDHVYHGNLTSLVDISPYKFDGPGGQGRRDHVWVAEMPDLYRGRFRYGDPHAGAGYVTSVATRLGEMAERGRRPAAFFSEAILGTGGMLTLPDGYLAAAYALVRAAGGVCVADEVQIGFGRVGSHMWAFEAEGAVPDIVTMGKPIGNGHPMAAVVTSMEIASAFANGMEYFSTFGGNPVSAAIGLSVLDVIREERLVHNASVVGDRLMSGLRELAERHEVIGDVRGRGLFVGVELIRDRHSLEPAASQLKRVVEAMKANRILLSTEGPHDNVMKIKPPIVFSEDNCDQFLDVLDRVLSSTR